MDLPRYGVQSMGSLTPKERGTYVHPGMVTIRPANVKGETRKMLVALLELDGCCDWPQDGRE